MSVQTTPAIADDDISDEEFQARLEKVFTRMRDPNRKRLTGAEIVKIGREKGLIGSRTDITDSAKFVEEMRSREERSRESR